LRASPKRRREFRSLDSCNQIVYPDANGVEHPGEAF